GSGPGGSAAGLGGAAGGGRGGGAPPPPMGSPGGPAGRSSTRLIREVGPLSDLPPPFPLATGAVMPLRQKAEAMGSGDFSPMWSGQAATLGRTLPAGELTRKLAAEALERMQKLGA